MHSAHDEENNRLGFERFLLIGKIWIKVENVKDPVISLRY